MKLAALFILHAGIVAHALAASPGVTPLIAYDRVSGTVSVARGSEIQLATEPRTNVELPFAPTLAAANRGRFLFADAIADRAVLVERSGVVVKQFATGTTPVRAVPFRDGFLILTRDDASLAFVASDGGMQQIDVPQGAALVETNGNVAFIYSPITGELVNLDPSLRITSRMKSSPGASDLEIAGNYVYLVHAKRGEIHAHDAATLKFLERVSAGAVPVDVEAIGDRTALGAGTLLIADPSSKRVWREEGSQSELEAFSRGFLRGVLGLGLYTPRSSEMPAGADRLMQSGSEVFALDSSSGALYHVGRKSVTRVATGVAWQSIVADGEGRVLLARGNGVETIAPPRPGSRQRRSARQ